MLLVSIGTFFEKGLRMGVGQCNVKRYNRQLRDLIIAGRAKPSFVVSHELPLGGGAQRLREVRPNESMATRKWYCIRERTPQSAITIAARRTHQREHWRFREWPQRLQAHTRRRRRYSIAALRVIESARLKGSGDRRSA